MLIALSVAPAPAKVFFDTSAPGARAADTTAPSAQPVPAAPPASADSAAAPSAVPAPSVPPAATVPSPPASDSTMAPAPGDASTPAPAPPTGGPPRPHFRNVLFLSADNLLVYSHIGVLKALEEFRLDVDLVLAESKSGLVAAAWALGYPARDIEARLLDPPLGDYLRPLRPRGDLRARYAPYGPDPLQVEVPLSLQSLQGADLQWSAGPRREDDEFLHLSWLVAKVTHDAPAGPVEDLRETPRPLAFQVTDLAEEQGKVILEGNLQAVLKASLLPKDVAHERERLRPYAPGDLVSGHAVMVDRLPFTCDRLIVVQPGRRLRPPSLEAAATPWEDSLARRLKTRPFEGAAMGKALQVVRIELQPDAGFDVADKDPRAWVELGHTSTLRSMDILIGALGARDTARVARAGAAPAYVPPPLDLNRFTVNPLASGGRQLLQDIVRHSVSERGDSTGEGPLADLVGSGYYSNLDLEWMRLGDEEHPALVFDALEKSRLLFQAGANAVNTGEDLPDRGPEMYAGLAWSEPFYVPFRAEGAFLLGGHRPGYLLRGMVAPVSPFPLEIGVALRDWTIRYPAPPSRAPDLEPRSFRLDRTRTDLFLNLLPLGGLRFGTAIQWHDMGFPAQDTVDGLLEPSSSSRGYQSVDFDQTLLLGLSPGPSGVFRQYLWGRYRNLNRVNLMGAIRQSSSSAEARLRLSLGPFRLLNQYFWSNIDADEPGLFEYVEAGEVSAFSFQDEYFLGLLRAGHFQNAQVELAPAFGPFGLRLKAGGFRLIGEALAESAGRDYTRYYWEAEASLATRAGPLRAGLAGLDGDDPLFFLRFGADLDLDPQGPER